MHNAVVAANYFILTIAVGIGTLVFISDRGIPIVLLATTTMIVSLNVPFEQLKEQLGSQGKTVIAQTDLSDRMEAHLTGPNFSISAITPENQAVAEKGITRWAWDLKPLARGTQTSHLTFCSVTWRYLAYM